MKKLRIRHLHKGGVDSCFYFLAGVAQVAGEEGLGALNFFADGVNVSVEGQFN